MPWFISNRIKFNSCFSINSNTLSSSSSFSSSSSSFNNFHRQSKCSHNNTSTLSSSSSSSSLPCHHHAHHICTFPELRYKRCTLRTARVTWLWIIFFVFAFVVVLCVEYKRAAALVMMFLFSWIVGCCCCWCFCYFFCWIRTQTSKRNKTKRSTKAKATDMDQIQRGMAGDAFTYRNWAGWRNALQLIVRGTLWRCTFLRFGRNVSFVQAICLLELDLYVLRTCVWVPARMRIVSCLCWDHVIGERFQGKRNFVSSSLFDRFIRLWNASQWENWSIRWNRNQNPNKTKLDKFGVRVICNYCILHNWFSNEALVDHFRRSMETHSWFSN